MGEGKIEGTLRASGSSMKTNRWSRVRVMAYDHSGRLAAKRLASSSIRGPLRMSFFRMLGARSLRPYSKPPDQKK
jgi:hypothetical protein